MAFATPSGTPGVKGTYEAQPRDIFRANRQFAQYLPGPLALDGANTSWAANAPYTWFIPAGMLVGRVTASGKFASSVIGLTSAAFTSGGTALSTDVNTAAEIVRRIGSSGTFKVTGPPAANGTVATYTVTFSAINTSTGVITVTDIGHNVISGAFIQPTDGSETIVTIVCDVNGNQVVDALYSTRQDVYDPQLLAGGGVIDVGYIINYPTDGSLRAYLKGALRAFVGGVIFTDDFMS